MGAELIAKDGGSPITPTKHQITDAERLRLALSLAMQPAEGVGDEVEPDQRPAPLTTFEQAAEQMGLRVPEVVEVLGDANFLKLVRNLSKARANLVFNAIAVPRLVDIAANGDDREALTAVKLLGSLTGDLKSGPQVEINLNFQDLWNRAEQARRSGQVIDLFGIRESAAIGEDEEDSDG